jgi:hypothetical protein
MMMNAADEERDDGNHPCEGDNEGDDDDDDDNDDDDDDDAPTWLYWWIVMVHNNNDNFHTLVGTTRKEMMRKTKQIEQSKRFELPSSSGYFGSYHPPCWLVVVVGGRYDSRRNVA